MIKIRGGFEEIRTKDEGRNGRHDMSRHVGTFNDMLWFCTSTGVSCILLIHWWKLFFPLSFENIKFETQNQLKGVSPPPLSLTD